MSNQSDLWKLLDEHSRKTGFGRQIRGVTHSDKKELARKISDLDNTAYNYYKLDQFDMALSLYQKAYRVAVQAGDEVNQIRYKEWEGHCLYHMGRLTEALAVLLELEKFTESSPIRWEGLINQLLIAIQIPISLQRIQSIIDRCYNEMRQYGLEKSNGMILLAESDLLTYQGKDALALKKAQEAMASYVADAFPSCEKIVYFDSLIWAYLNIGDWKNAKQWLGRFEAYDSSFPVSKESRVLSIRRRLALQDKDYLAAWAYAEQELFKARESVAHPYAALKNITNCGISAGKPGDIRNYLAELISTHRNSETGHHRYQIRKTAGDYHRAMAALPNTVPEQVAHHRKLAKRYYSHAMKVGRMIDERLCCHWRQEEILKRLKSVE